MYQLIARLHFALLALTDPSVRPSRWRDDRGQATTENLSMVLVDHNGTQSEIATWVGVNGATALPSGNTTLQKNQIKSVQLVDSDTRAVLLQSDL